MFRRKPKQQPINVVDWYVDSARRALAAGHQIHQCRIERQHWHPPRPNQPDTNAILNAIAQEGWELTDTSQVFRTDGTNSAGAGLMIGPVLAGGGSSAAYGTDVGTYTFKRSEAAARRGMGQQGGEAN